MEISECILAAETEQVNSILLSTALPIVASAWRLAGLEKNQIESSGF
jgi:hypothetical protein